jgi:hypothetical protein
MLEAQEAHRLFLGRGGQGAVLVLPFCSFFVEQFLLNFIELGFVFLSLLSSASLDTNLVLGLGWQELGSTVERTALRRQGIVKIYLGFLFSLSVIGLRYA